MSERVFCRHCNQQATWLFFCPEHADRVTREDKIMVAVQMRERGHVMAEIARAIRCDPMTVSVYLMESGNWGLVHKDVRRQRGTMPQYPGHRPTEELSLSG